VFPDDVKYTAEHEWVRASGEGGEAVLRVGITSYAQEALGDIVFVTLPTVGTEVEPGQSLGEVESTKSVSDVYAPLAGTVTAGLVLMYVVSTGVASLSTRLITLAEPLLVAVTR